MMTAFVIKWIAFPLLTTTLVAACVRLALGPRPEERVVAFDLIAITLTGLIVVASLYYRQRPLLDMMVALTLLSFLGTVGFATFLEKAEDQDAD